MEPQDKEWIIKYFERVIADQDRRIEQAFESARDAVDKAEAAQERRLALLNEFREQSLEEGKKYALRESSERRLNRLEGQVARLYGGLGVFALIGVANLVRVWTG